MYNVLICDDERDIVSALKIYLESEGYATFPAYDGREALELLRELSAERQIILFTCHRREGEMMKKYPQVRIINA